MNEEAFGNECGMLASQQTRGDLGRAIAALCPFCPALQTPEIGYLNPPVKGSRQKKQEFLRNTFEFHHYNG